MNFDDFSGKFCNSDIKFPMIKAAKAVLNKPAVIQSSKKPTITQSLSVTTAISTTTTLTTTSEDIFLNQKMVRSICSKGDGFCKF